MCEDGKRDRPVRQGSVIESYKKVLPVERLVGRILTAVSGRFSITLISSLRC